MDKVIKKDFSDFLEENYLDYGITVNETRAIPGTDGLKPVHRRVLLGLKDCADGKLTSTVNAIGSIQLYHPFGDASIFGVISDMSRIKAIDSHGSVGVKLIENIPAAAARYTKSGLSKQQSKYWFRLSDYSPQVESDVGMEPQYLIAPVPYCLVYGALNWGFGVMGRTPGFTYDSLIDAYLNNDPNKLVPQYGYKCNYDESDLQGLWETGEGKLSISYKVNRLDYNEILIYGSGESFVPKFGALDKWIDEGKIEVINESTSEVAIRIRKTYRAHCNMDEVYEACLQIAKFTRKYTILMVDNGTVVKMPIKKWLDLTIVRYVKAYEQYKKDRVDKLNFEITVLKYITEVGQQLLDNKSDEDILSSTNGLTEEILSSIKRKSISSLRKKDTVNEQKELESKIKSIQSEKAEEELLNPIS